MDCVVPQGSSLLGSYLQVDGSGVWTSLELCDDGVAHLHYGEWTPPGPDTGIWRLVEEHVEVVFATGLPARYAPISYLCFDFLVEIDRMPAFCRWLAEGREPEPVPYSAHLRKDRTSGRRIDSPTMPSRWRTYVSPGPRR